MNSKCRLGLTVLERLDMDMSQQATHAPNLWRVWDFPGLEVSAREFASFARDPYPHRQSLFMIEKRSLPQENCDVISSGSGPGTRTQNSLSLPPWHSEEA